MERTAQNNLPHAADVPVLVQHLGVDVLGVDGVRQRGLDDEVAKVDLNQSKPSSVSLQSQTRHHNTARLVFHSRPARR